MFLVRLNLMYNDGEKILLRVNKCRKLETCSWTKMINKFASINSCEVVVKSLVILMSMLVNMYICLL